MGAFPVYGGGNYPRPRPTVPVHRAALLWHRALGALRDQQMLGGEAAREAARRAEDLRNSKVLRDGRLVELSAAAEPPHRPGLQAQHSSTKLVPTSDESFNSRTSRLEREDSFSSRRIHIEAPTPD